MKIKFDEKEFEIYGIQYEFDENNVPIDIVICATQETLEEIQHHCYVGCNMQEVNICHNSWSRNFHHCWEGLFARLESFEIVGARQAYIY